MKQIKIKIAAFAILLATASGCKKSAIEIAPTHLETQEFALKTIDNFEQALSAMYNNLRVVGYYGRNYSILADMNNDNLLQTGESLVNFLQITDWLYVADNVTVAETWQAAYRVVNDANIIINNIAKVTTAANQKKVNRIKGQALAIRAMAHFDLMRWFSDNMDRNSTSPGVHYNKLSVLEISPVTVKPSRQSVKENYDNIYADLTEARTLLGDVDAAINTATNKSKIDLLGVAAIWARVGLYAKDYTRAITEATTVINAVPIASRAVFPQIFKDQSSAEVVFSVPFSSGEFLSRVAGDCFSGPINRSQQEGAPSLFAQIDEANDIRFSVNVTRGFGTLATPVRGPNRLVITKHLGKGSATDCIVNWKAFRTAEMYLIRAEANARKAGPDEAAANADLNLLRSNRITGYVNVNLAGQALLDAIELERRKELFMEGHRWFDLKRTIRTIDRGVIAAPTTQATLASNSPKWVWPIPQGERDANPNMGQNPGY
ncbi:MAG: RagB/SusD family nutrient uptake outer membrane protein [Dinghuibacter sp.]|nr:RagB/SusD family nutrient uptake outer membrane protein [Dinghuibacter sp.]